MKGIFFCITILWVCVNTNAQDKRNIKYGGMQQLGVAIEENAVKAMPNMINGVRFGNWFTGVGVAYEINPNRWRAVNTLPVYLDARYYFFKKKWVFVVSDIGINWTAGNEWMRTQANDKLSKRSGFYANLGAGVKARLGRSTFYSFDVSYNWKQTRYEYQWEDWQSLIRTESNNFKQRRILIRLGMEI